jgi:hypothetical protein
VLEEATARDMEGLDANLHPLAHKMLLRHGSVWESSSAEIQEFGIDLLVMAHFVLNLALLPLPDRVQCHSVK